MKYIYILMSVEPEIFGGLWDNISIQLEGDPPFLLACNVYVEEDSRVLHRHCSNICRCECSDVLADN